MVMPFKGPAQKTIEMDMTVDPKKSLSFTDIEETFDKIRK